MNYQKNMKKIMEQLNEYKEIIDSLSTCYLADKKKHEEELQKMQGVYTPEYIAEHGRHWKPAEDYARGISTAREVCKENISSCLGQIKREIDNYFCIPVDSGFAATVTAVKNLGVTLNNREFELLQEASGGYWERRLLNELAVSRTKTEQRAVVEDGQAKRTETETKKPFRAVKLPDIEKAYESLQNVKNAVNTALDGYCGEGNVLKDIIFPLSAETETTNEKLEKEYGVHPEKQTRSAWEVVQMVGASAAFDENSRLYSDFTEMMDGLAATMPKKERKTVLTASDKNLIDTMIDSKYEFAARDQAVRLAKADERLAEILRLDKRYGAKVREALGEVSDDE